MALPLTASQVTDLSLAQPSNAPIKGGSYKKMFRSISAGQFHFPEGLVGLSQMKEIRVQEFLSTTGSGLHLFQLKSEGEKGLTFVALPLASVSLKEKISPLLDQAMEMLAWPAEETNWLFLLSAQGDDSPEPAKMSVNCRGPIGLNMKKKIGIQAIIHEKSIPAKYTIGSFTNNL